jgi:hypothetical protein
LSHADSDSFYWEDTDPPFTNSRPVEVMHSLFYDFMSRDGLVLSGDVLNWGLPEEDVLNAFTHVIFTYVPWEEREKRLRAREQGRFGSRVLTGGDMHSLHEGFIEWSRCYDSGTMPGRNKQSQLEFLEKIKNKGGRVLKIDGLLTAEDILSRSLAFVEDART